MEMADAAGPRPHPVMVAGRRIDWSPLDVAFGVVAFLAAFIVLPLLLILPAWAVYRWDSTDDRGFLAASIIVSAPVYLAILYIAAHFSFRKYGGSPRVLGFGMPRWSTLGWGVLALVGALAVSAAYSGIIEAFDLDALRQGCDDQVPMEIRDDHLLLALSSVLAVVFAPACEETFFRGFAFPGIARTLGVIPGIVISGLLFGGAHLVGNPTLWPSFILFSAIGIVFAAAYWRSENLLSTILAHTAFNVIGVIAIAATTCEP